MIWKSVLLLFALLLAAVWLDLIDPKLFDQDKLLGEISEDLAALGDSWQSDGKTSAKVYKYQDDNGQWHFSNQPFVNQAEQATSTYRLDTNVLPTLTPPAEDTADHSAMAAQASGNKPAQPQEDIEPSPLSLYTDPERVKELIQEAKQLQGKLTQRAEAMDPGAAAAAE